jgi:hypothetical protein
MKSVWHTVCGAALVLSLAFAGALAQAQPLSPVPLDPSADDLVVLAQAKKKSDAQLRKCERACSIRCDSKKNPSACTRMCIVKKC